MHAVKPKIAITSILKNDSGIKKQLQSGVLSNAVKELAKMFNEVTEIGRFEKIRVEIPEPLKNCSVNKASIIIEPSANPHDFRTRVISFIAYSPDNPNVKNSVMEKKGIKRDIDKLLNEDKAALIADFKAFLKKSEKEFERAHPSTYSD